MASDGSDVTREVFRNIGPFWVVVFYIIVAIEVGVFFYGMYRLFKKYKSGRSESISRFDNPLKRLIRPLFGWNSKGKLEERDTKIYIAHSLVLYGIILLFIGTVILTIDHDFVRILFDTSFFWGTFYIIYSLIMDISGVAVIVGLVYLGLRRRENPERLNYKRVDERAFSEGRKRFPTEDRFFLLAILTIIFTGFILEGVRIVADGFPEFERVSFLGYLLALLFGLIIQASTAEIIYVVLWWFHFFLATFFIALIPFTKGMHILIDYFSIATADPIAAKRLPKISADQTVSGYNTINDLTWRELISLDACIKCGKCHIACPAQTVEQPLSPRDLILDLKEHATKSLGTVELAIWGKDESQRDLPLVMSDNPIVLGETIWSCTTCGACVEHCPVAVEHVPLIVQLRRRMVEEGNIDAGIQSVLENTGKYGNSFGKSNRMRARWTKKLEFKIPDVRKEEVDFLWYVGDFASFDPRVQEDTINVAKILNKAGIKFGLLYDGEKTAGNDIRRVGEEGLFEMLVEENMASMEKANFKKIVTTDPHTLNTLRYEYPEFNGGFIENPHQNVIHYSQMLWELVESGKIKIVNKGSGIVTYHDPCYLGRYQQEYDAPRNLIKALGYDLVDMPRCRENSFCCGAGGGMIWMADEPEGDRPALNRIREANNLNPAKFIVACPKDKVMFSDAAKTMDANYEVVDIVKLLYDAIDKPQKEIEQKASSETEE